MRLCLHLTPLLLLIASVPGCGSKSPAESDRPPGVIENPDRPDSETIKNRKRMLIDPQRGGAPSRFNGKR